MTKQFKELTDSQWDAISPFLDIKRKRKLSLRSVVNALLYLVRTGCQWRNLPDKYPNWRAVNYYFERWKQDGTLILMNDQLNKLDRLRSDRSASPSLMCVDSQSVKLSPMIYEDRGLDNHKKVNGRKRQLLVDTGGRLWRVIVHAANRHDGPAGSELLEDTGAFGERLEKILGDDAYSGQFAKKAQEKGFVFEKASRAESAKGFVPVAKRWVVERTIAWTNFFRRIVKDYEYTVLSSATWLILANLTIMLQRIPHPNK
jgi:transposase